MTNCLLLAAVLFLVGLMVGSSCNEPNFDEPIKSVSIIERPIYIKDTVKIKQVKFKIRDFISSDTILIPCSDTAFIAFADSVITSTNDTLNMAFNYADRKGYFSLDFRPRPDTLQTVTINIPIESKHEYAWWAGTFGIGLVLGVLGGTVK